MKAATRKALESSIQKWEEIVGGIVKDLGSDNCSLCRRFCKGFSTTCVRDDGEKCPVYIASGYTQCLKTPHEDWRKAHALNGRGWFWEKAYDDESVMCAVLELEFLKSLRPKKD